MQIAAQGSYLPQRLFTGIFNFASESQNFSSKTNVSGRFFITSGLEGPRIGVRFRDFAPNLTPAFSSNFPILPTFS